MGLRHVLWAVAWMGLGLLITLAAASVLQGVATNQRPHSGPVFEAPPQLDSPQQRRVPGDPGRSLILVSRGSGVDQ
ncbi:MAG: hypothetical protein KIT25_24955 [Enhydrobacter sp.]|nr:MAG: hypothetical protein KIT25_24955 [Enhydrobacter sp.]